MHSLMICLMAAGSASLSNLFFRKNSSGPSSNSNSYLLIFYLLSFLFSLFIFPDIWHTPVNFKMLIIGGFAGLFNIILMLLTAQALKQGPSGLTFAFQNASSIFPAVILYVLFGTEFGYMIYYSQLLGIFFVLLGLFLGTRSSGNEEKAISFSWLKYALACLIVQILALTFIQGRCVLFECAGTDHFYAPLAVDQSADVWFMPGQFGIALILQSIIFFSNRSGMQKKDLLYGSLGGIANGLSTFLLLMATKYALSSEQGLLLPTFSVATIILCNLWAKWLYQEKFNYAANACCSLGIVIGSIA